MVNRKSAPTGESTLAEVLLALDLFRFIEGVVTCSFCRRVFQSPLVLSACCHTFCCDCIRQAVVKGSDTTLTEDLKCPQCSQVTVLPSGKGVDSLVKNFMVEKLLEITRFVRTVDRAKISRQVVIDFIRRIRDVTECPVCCEHFSEPRLLPCIHTFCVGCLKGSSTSNVWKPTTCPLCRQLFVVPDSGFTSLPRNDVLDRILQKMSQPEVQQLVTLVLDPDRVPETEREVTGVTELGGIIYVLFSSLKVIQLFQTEHPYAMITVIPLPRGIFANDLTSCKLENCLFITDFAGLGSVWRVQIEKQRLDAFVVHSVVKVADGRAGAAEKSGEASAVSIERSDSQAQMSDVVSHGPEPFEVVVNSAASAMEETGDAVAASAGDAGDRPVESRDPRRHDTLADFLARFVNATRNRTTWTPETGSLDSHAASPDESELIDRDLWTDDVTESTSDSDALDQECPEAFRRIIEAIVEQKIGKSTDNVKPTVLVEHRVQLWLRDVKSIGASVGPDCQLVLVTSSGDLFVYCTANRDLIGRYVLPEEVQRPRHAVIHCKTGNFIVSHSAPDGSIHRISELKLDQKTGRLHVIRGYGSTPGQQYGHLHWPRHLAADARGFTFLADCSNNRVLLFDENLVMQRVMLSHHHNLGLPWRLTLVPEFGLLVVGSVTGSVQIYSIERKRRRK